MKTFDEAQFGCCPLVWMFHGRALNKKVNHMHKRSLHIVYEDYNSSFNDLLKKDKYNKNDVFTIDRSLQLYLKRDSGTGAFL